MFENNVIDHEFPSSHGREKAPNPEGGPTRREAPGSTVQLRAGESTYRLAVDLQGRTDVGAVATADPLHDVADGTAVRPILRAFRVLAQELAILESRLAVDAGPLRLGGEVGAHHLRALDVALSADLRQRPGLPCGLSP